MQRKGLQDAVNACLPFEGHLPAPVYYPAGWDRQVGCPCIRDPGQIQVLNPQIAQSKNVGISQEIYTRSPCGAVQASGQKIILR